MDHVQPIPEEELEAARQLFRSHLTVQMHKVFDHEVRRVGITHREIADKLSIPVAMAIRWLSCPETMTLRSIAYIAAACDADLTIELVDKVTGERV